MNHQQSLHKKEKVSSDFKSHSCSTACMCLYCTVWGKHGSRFHIRLHCESSRTATYNKLQRFHQIKASLPSSSFYASMHATQQGMLTNIPVSHWSPTFRPDETEKQSERGTNCSILKETWAANDWHVLSVQYLIHKFMKTLLEQLPL